MKFTQNELKMICIALYSFAGLKRISGGLKAGDKFDKLADKIEKELLK